VLTVGDGLVTQVPALIVPPRRACGLQGRHHRCADKALIRRLRLSAGARHVGRRDAGWRCCRHLMPHRAGGGAAALAWKAQKQPPRQGCGSGSPGAPDIAAVAASAAADEPISTASRSTSKIELGYALLPLVNAPTATAA
jgi:flagellar biosynthesis protein FlhA